MNPYIDEKEKKRLIKIIVGTLLTVITVFTVTTVGNNMASSGVIGIRSLEELEKIGRQEGYPSDGEYALEQDIDGGGRTITAIGSEDEPFTGHFDGQGHTIRNLIVEVEEVREIQTREIAAAEPDGEQAAEEEAQKETAEQVKLIVSADGYPVFEYTTKEKQDQIENLCLCRVKAAEKKTDAQSGLKKTIPKPNSGKEKPKEKPAVQIHTWEEFKNIGNTGYNPSYTMDADYVLAESIKSDGSKFTLIGTSENPFTGTFDGRGKKIDVSANPEIDTKAAYNGLFGTVKRKGGEKDGK